VVYEKVAEEILAKPVPPVLGKLIDEELNNVPTEALPVERSESVVAERRWPVVDVACPAPRFLTPPEFRLHLMRIHTAGLPVRRLPLDQPFADVMQEMLVESGRRIELRNLRDRVVIELLEHPLVLPSAPSFEWPDSPDAEELADSSDSDEDIRSISSRASTGSHLPGDTASDVDDMAHFDDQFEEVQPRFMFDVVTQFVPEVRMPIPPAPPMPVPPMRHGPYGFVPDAPAMPRVLLPPKYGNRITLWGQSFVDDIKASLLRLKHVLFNGRIPPSLPELPDRYLYDDPFSIKHLDFAALDQSHARVFFRAKKLGGGSFWGRLFQSILEGLPFAETEQVDVPPSPHCVGVLHKTSVHGKIQEVVSYRILGCKWQLATFKKDRAAFDTMKRYNAFVDGSHFPALTDYIITNPGLVSFAAITKLDVVNPRTLSAIQHLVSQIDKANDPFDGVRLADFLRTSRKAVCMSIMFAHNQLVNDSSFIQRVNEETLENT